MNFGVDRGVDAGASGAASTWDANLVDYLPAGDGAVEESVRAALRRIVHRGQYSSQGNYETARDALSDTAGVNNLDVTGDAAITGSLTVGGVNVVVSAKAFAVAMALALG